MRSLVGNHEHLTGVDEVHVVDTVVRSQVIGIDPMFLGDPTQHVPTLHRIGT
jgi:hypothetical protein